MNHCAKHILKAGWLAGLLLGLTVTSCTDLIFDDRDGCERGVYVNFVYDYNLHRSDLFADHVGEVTLYIFDEQGNYIDSLTEANDDEFQPLREYGYNMYLDLPDGKYRFVALAHQCKSDDQRGSFMRTEMNENSRMEDLQITLDHNRLYDGVGAVNHQGEPLDTIGIPYPTSLSKCDKGSMPITPCRWSETPITSVSPCAMWTTPQRWTSTTTTFTSPEATSG